MQKWFHLTPVKKFLVANYSLKGSKLPLFFFRGRKLRGAKGPWPLTFYNFSTRTGFLPYKLILLSLCGPQISVPFSSPIAARLILMEWSFSLASPFLSVKITEIYRVILHVLIWACSRYISFQAISDVTILFNCRCCLSLSNKLFDFKLCKCHNSGQ